MPKLISTALAGLLVAALLTGCTGQVPAASPTPSASSATVATPAGPPSLSDDDLYALAVSQYRQLYAIITDVDRHGGATVFPDASRQFMMDPAWSAYNDLYVQDLIGGDHFVGTPEYSITKIARLVGEDMPPGTVIALQTCELFQGAARVDKKGDTVQDGSPVIRHLKAYMKFNDQDWLLKVFVLNGEGVDTCPF